MTRSYFIMNTARSLLLDYLKFHHHRIRTLILPASVAAISQTQMVRSILAGRHLVFFGKQQIQDPHPQFDHGILDSRILFCVIEYYCVHLRFRRSVHHRYFIKDALMKINVNKICGLDRIYAQK